MNKHDGLIPVAVRADFTKNGEIIPLGFTDESGKTYIIDKIEKIIPVQVDKYTIKMQFYCKSNKIWFWLYLIDKTWYK
ncbi:hypothetical protein [Tissierella praeacuta]|uniref:hypothetical protein n=1 Tax=Tissierella praeacuta TaxID=43131 RepID=UPI0028A65A80|nr:hypothetical protein [Tissierella praeacuta]